MDNPKNHDFIDNHADQSNGDDIITDTSDSSTLNHLSISSSVVETSSVGSGSVSREDRGVRREVGLTERLTDFLVAEGDGDLLLQNTVREDRVLEWLQALDMQITGACRADERMKPLLKMNAPSGVAEDRLLAHISQHFQPSEIGLLARCFCIPLVSIRVGKINKEGTRLCPTATRGSIRLALLPTSDLRLSFIGDNGHTERIFTLSSEYQCSAVVIEDITADNSGRSFLIKVPDGKVYYYWCSEKSKLLGIELLLKMKDLIKRKPSIAELTGISESRMSRFATHIRVYLMGSAATTIQSSSVGLSIPLNATSLNATSDISDLSQSPQGPTISAKSLRSRHSGSQVTKSNSVYQVSLSPRSSSFKEGMLKNIPSLRISVREKLRRRGENHLPAVDNPTVASPISSDTSNSRQIENENLSNVESCSFGPSFLESLGNWAPSPTVSVVGSHDPSMGPALFTPCYLWCPPGASTLQHGVAPQQYPTSSVELPFLPPLSSLLPSTGSPTLFTPTSSLHFPEHSSFDFPPLIPDPLARLPIPNSQQIIPTFTPLMCDPIVHIPVIDVCSSGQGYLVSAGPTISPLHANIMNPVLSENDSMVEKGARETLRLLISGSSPMNPPLMNVLPVVFSKSDETQSILVTGSHGLYSGISGITDVGGFAESFASVSLVTFSGSSEANNAVKICSSSNNNNVDAMVDGSSGLGGSGNNPCVADHDGDSYSREERYD